MLSRGWQGKKWPKMKKKFFLWHVLFQELYIIWSSFKYLQAFFSFFWKILILEIIREGGTGEGGRGGGVKEQNLAQNYKKCCVSLRISGTVHHMIIIFGTHTQNDDISNNLFLFLKFWFLEFLGGKRAKK